MKITQQQADLFIMTNGKYFEGYHLHQIREQLLQLDESKWAILQVIQFKDPTISLIVSLIGGALGIDRFLIGDVGLGIGKLITCGGLWVWTVVDWFLIMGATREKNLQRLLSYMH